jgi:tRNA pseudouridine38-40 synthase
MTSRNIKLTIEYDGAGYHGWQVQGGLPTIQRMVQDAIEAVTGERPPLYGSGRTDSGVHATGQVANFHSTTTIPCEALARALNANLPKDIAVLLAADVPEDFHARYSARSKVYRYRIYNGPVRRPLRRRTWWHVRQPLDVDAMGDAAACFIGEHDFSAFESKSDPHEDSVRRILRLDVTVVDADVIDFTVESTGFLYNMVRAIVGTLVEVGRGSLAAGNVPAVLASRDRARAGPTAPARGLCLTVVHYDQ